MEERTMLIVVVCVALALSCVAVWRLCARRRGNQGAGLPHKSVSKAYVEIPDATDRKN